MSTASALWTLARPRMLPLVLLLPALGFGWAHWEYRLPLRHPAGLGWVCLAWTALHAGSLWLNATLDQDQDQDEDAVLFGRAQPVPGSTNLAAYAALALSPALALLASPGSGLAAAAAAVLAILYSHRATAWKGHPVGGPAVNALGYGLLSPLAGWSVVGVPATLHSVAVWVLLPLGLLAPTFVAQAFQGPADAARGYRTLVVTHGPEGCRRAARRTLRLALAGGMVLALMGWVPRLCALGALLWLWPDRILAPSNAPPSPDLAQRLISAMFVATAATLALAVLAL